MQSQKPPTTCWFSAGNEEGMTPINHPRVGFLSRNPPKPVHSRVIPCLSHQEPPPHKKKTPTPNPACTRVIPCLSHQETRKKKEKRKRNKPPLLLPPNKKTKKTDNKPTKKPPNPNPKPSNPKTPPAGEWRSGAGCAPGGGVGQKHSAWPLWT